MSASKSLAQKFARRFFIVSLFALCGVSSALANTKYYIADYTGPTWPKHSTAAEICTGYRDLVQKSADEANPGGTSVVKKWPDENIPATLTISTPCVINWSRTVNGHTSSFDYTYYIFAGLCDPGQTLNQDTQQCTGDYYIATDTSQQEQCGETCNAIGDPVNPATGGVYKSEEDVAATDALPPFRRYYNSLDSSGSRLGPGWRYSFTRSIKKRYDEPPPRALTGSDGESPTYGTRSIACLDGFDRIKQQVVAWQTAHTTFESGVCTVWKNGARIGYLTIYTRGTPIPSQTVIGYDVTRDDGTVIYFPVESGVLIQPPGTSYQLSLSGNSMILRDPNDARETYDASGRLISIQHRSGQTDSAAYDSSGRLASFLLASGHTFSFSYDSQERLAGITTPTSENVTYSYDSNGRLNHAYFPDSTSRTYLYENASFPNALTGEEDENQVRFSTWTYGADGRAASTYEGSQVNRAALLSSTNLSASTRTRSLHFQPYAR